MGGLLQAKRESEVLVPVEGWPSISIYVHGINGVSIHRGLGCAEGLVQGERGQYHQGIWPAARNPQGGFVSR
jgi:hypothetical protein